MPPPAPAGVRIRPGRRGDSDALAALLKELGYKEAADSQTLNWVISHPEVEVIVAVDSGDRAIGMATLSHRPQLRLRGRTGTIEELVVTESWRRKGVGKALLMQTVTRAKALSVRRLELATHGQKADPGTVAFCEAAGFTLEDVTVFTRVP